MENNKAFMLTNSGKSSFFFTATDNFYQQIISIERIKMTSLLKELKGMLHHRFF
jgi:hypothetical protein